MLPLLNWFANSWNDMVDRLGDGDLGIVASRVCGGDGKPMEDVRCLLEG